MSGTNTNSGGKPSRVLIVDDMAVNRMILSSLLASAGVDADLAESGQECVALCRDKDYDLILLDHRMPEMDGVDTLLKLKEIFESRGKATPVVCHTTEDARNNINLYKAAGFADVLIKPIQPRQMWEILMTYLPEGAYAAADTEDARIRGEIGALPDWIKAVAGLDLRKGIENCETAEDFLDALSVFVNSAAEKADEIERLASVRDFKLYTMRVHSLKSMSRLIGAIRLSDMAAGLEDAGKRMDAYSIENHTAELLRDYRAFSKLKLKLDEPEPEEAEAPAQNSILFVDGEAGFISKTLTDKLKEAGSRLRIVKPELDEISANISSARTVLYYLPGDHSAMLKTLAILFELCRYGHKLLCVAGEPAQVAEAEKLDSRHQIHAAFRRPIDMDRMIEEMQDIADSYAEYERRKKLLLIDDDRDFLSILSRWLGTSYEVECAGSGAEAMKYLAGERVDLILLDYELPDEDGYEILERVRKNPLTAKIPVVFLTGMNDKEGVMRILKRKPDGYFLKSTGKDELLDSLDRFFESYTLG